MPLKKGKKNIGPNIKEMEANGKPYRVARAAALNEADGPVKKAKKKAEPKPKSSKKPAKKMTGID